MSKIFCLDLNGKFHQIFFVFTSFRPSDAPIYKCNAIQTKLACDTHFAIQFETFKHHTKQQCSVLHSIHKLLPFVFGFAYQRVYICPSKLKVKKMNSHKLSFLLDDEDEFLLLILSTQIQRSEIRDILKKRNEEGFFNILVERYLMDDETLFVMYFRLSRNLFQRVADLIRNDISNSHPLGGSKRTRLSTEHKLSIALRYIVSGNSQRSLQFDSRVSQERISHIIKEVFSAIAKNMPMLMPVPSENDWKKHAANFFRMWNFPHVIGAIDGKHIRIQCPSNSGSLYFNYKGFNYTHSI